ncbi:Kinase suppressor of Ras 1, partial [Galemys pyrenaicus]
SGICFSCSLGALRVGARGGCHVLRQVVASVRDPPCQQLAPATQRRPTLARSRMRRLPGPLAAHRSLAVFVLPQEILRELTLDALLEMNEAKVKETLRRCGASAEECSRLQCALTCLRKVTGLGGEHREDSGWSSLDARRESSSGPSSDTFSAVSLLWPLGTSRLGSSAQGPRSVSVSTLPASDSLNPGLTEGLSDTCLPLHTSGRLTPRALHNFITPPTTPQLRRHTKPKPPRTPPPPSRKVFQLLPSFPTLTRSKSHESQLGNRIDEVSPMRSSARIPTDGTKGHWAIGDAQVCHVCQKSMMFGVKCKHCRLKCHNRCTKEAPACRISFLPREFPAPPPAVSWIWVPRLRRTESVPSDINNPVDRAAEPHFGTLPKALTKKEHPPAMNHLDSSSNPSSTTSSTPSSPAPFPASSNPPSATTPPNPSPGQRDSRFNFPDISAFPQAAPEAADSTRLDDQTRADMLEDQEVEAEEPEAGKSEVEDDEDEVDDLPSPRRPWRGPISRKASQTSVYLQEWDIPFEQVELGEPIGQGRWGRVHRGRWHGEVAIRLLEMDGHNQDHLKLFKKEVMNYRQTRHENVVLFMGACMNPPHLAIITSFCKGRTLHSFVRDPKISLDINKTRQIAQEIIKGMGYLHAKGIVHKDLKSKNVFYDNGKVVITDFGLFGMSGVVREGRRENQLKLSHDWLCYLAPEIVREMTPGKDEDQLPFSKAADVYAFGTVWYELQARDWPFKNQAAEALIWQIGSGEGMKRVLASVSLGKEVTEILSACWAFDLQERPSFTLLMDMLEKLPKLNRRLSHPGHFWKSADRWRSRYYGKGRYALAAAKSYPGLKGLAWASWSPVTQRCSQLCGFSADFCLKCVSRIPKPPQDKENTLKHQPLSYVLQTRNRRPNFRFARENVGQELQPCLLFLKMTPPTASCPPRRRMFTHVFCGVNLVFYER